MMATKIYIDANETCIHDFNDGRQYGSWESDYDFNVNSASLSGDDWKEIVTIGSDMGVGDIIYILSIRFGTGDSFGSASGRGEVIYAFKDAGVAMEAKRIWEKYGVDEFSITFLDDEGNEVKMSNPAAGYFETLECVSVDVFTLGE
jgi:hypothetical protein